jgi:hypothetical protein
LSRKLFLALPLPKAELRKRSWKGRRGKIKFHIPDIF